jgi:hypothetical protein
MNPQTVFVRNADGTPLMINVEDFDASKHEPFDEASAALVEPMMRAASIERAAPQEPEQLEQIEPPAPQAPDQGEPMIEPQQTDQGAPATAPEAVQPPTEMFVTKKSARKFIVTDRDGNPIAAAGIEENGYGTEAEAWAAIMARNTG